MLPCGPGSPGGAYLYQQRPLGIAGRRVAHPAPRCIPADVAGPIRIVHRIIAEVVDARDKVTLPQEPLRPGGPGGTLQALRTDVTLRPLRPLCPGESHITLGPLGTHRPDVTLRAWQPRWRLPVPATPTGDCRPASRSSRTPLHSRRCSWTHPYSAPHHCGGSRRS